jgi:hypothetical protein
MVLESVSQEKHIDALLMPREGSVRFNEILHTVGSQHERKSFDCALILTWVALGMSVEPFRSMAESPASSSVDCPNHDFWIARHPGTNRHLSI